jgi:hypothetical protein
MFHYGVMLEPMTVLEYSRREENCGDTQAHTIIKYLKNVAHLVSSFFPHTPLANLSVRGEIV